MLRYLSVKAKVLILTRYKPDKDNISDYVRYLNILKLKRKRAKERVSDIEIFINGVEKEIIRWKDKKRQASELKAVMDKLPLLKEGD